MAMISVTASGKPKLSHRHNNGKWRAVIGWNHMSDTVNGREAGEIWCWVSDAPFKLQLFDSEHNRPTNHGESRDCGVANFTMIKMFHPYWVHHGRAPRDGVSADKQMLREKYHDLIREHRLELGLPADEDPTEYAMRIAAEKQLQKDQRKAQKEQLTSRAQEKRDAQLQRQKELEDAIPGVLEELVGGSADDPMALSEDEDLSQHMLHNPSKNFSAFSEWGTKDDPVELD